MPQKKKQKGSSQQKNASHPSEATSSEKQLLQQPAPQPNHWIISLVGLGILALAVMAGFLLRPDQPEGDSKGDSSSEKSLSDSSTGLKLPGNHPQLENGLEPESTVFARYMGSASCKECHSEAYEKWTHSNHALAERPITQEMDLDAFDPPKSFETPETKTDARLRQELFEVVTRGFNNNVEPYAIQRVIGNDPLRQFLVDGGAGRLQTLEVAYDPKAKEWFNVYGEEDRRPGEWGHWTGRGMNWNAMCAACHNTRVRKNYDPEKDAYHTTMAEMSVSCEACHGPMKSHVEGWRSAKSSGSQYVDAEAETRSRLAIERSMQTCGTCHSRRGELTGDFVPGDPFFDHYTLVIPDESELYHADGQVADENYVYGSFMGSKMSAAGVKCMDCHDPHTSRTILPGNDLCMRCHTGSYPKSPKIEPASHTFHASTSEGSQCVNCHMPQTTYMQRHKRRDHGFTIPDPYLTVRYGTPNACNRCHTDQDANWSEKWVNAWYGEKMNRSTRQRAEWIEMARSGNPDAMEPLLTLLKTETNPYWQAVAVGLLDPWVYETEARTALIESLKHTSPLVRASAALSLGPLVQSDPSDPTRRKIEPLLEDPVRLVRVNAAWALRGKVPPNSRAAKEVAMYLIHNSDQPTGSLQQGAYYLAQGNTSKALDYFQNAVNWDPNSAPLRHELAVAWSIKGDLRKSISELEKAAELDPIQAEYPFKLALAWNELNQLDKAIQSLEKAVELDPRHPRAWYNLGLAYNSNGDPEDGVKALIRAESVNPLDPSIPYARATIHARLGEIDEARAATSRALELQPNYAPASSLLESLPRQ